MKRLASLLLVTAAALAASSARADTRVSVGVNFGAPVYRSEAPAVVYAPAPPAVYVPAPVEVCPPAPVVVVPARGYWRDVQVRAWVPERWVVRTNRWGRPERYCEPGYYTYRTERVWVDGRHERERGYGYDYRGGWNR